MRLLARIPLADGELRPLSLPIGLMHRSRNQVRAFYHTRLVLARRPGGVHKIGITAMVISQCHRGGTMGMTVGKSPRLVGAILTV
jgi:hypothetical protein